MPYSLDADACIAHLRGARQGKLLPVSQRLRSERQQDIVVCSVVRVELLFGAKKSANPLLSVLETEQFFQGFASAPFDDRAAEVYAHIRRFLERLGTPIGRFDMLIAAVSLANGLTLVTHNTREFSRIPGLQLEDWQ